MINFLKALFSTNSTKTKIVRIINDIETIVKLVCHEKLSIYWYGAYEIDPKNLVIWVCVETDEVKVKLEANSELISKFHNTLIKHNYPEQAVKSVYIGFESQETVDRESNGKWYEHFK